MFCRQTFHSASLNHRWRLLFLGYGSAATVIAKQGPAGGGSGPDGQPKCYFGAASGDQSSQGQSIHSSSFKVWLLRVCYVSTQTYDSLYSRKQNISTIAGSLQSHQPNSGLPLLVHSLQSHQPNGGLPLLVDSLQSHQPNGGLRLFNHVRVNSDMRSRQREEALLLFIWYTMWQRCLASVHACRGMYLLKYLNIVSLWKQSYRSWWCLILVLTAKVMERKDINVDVTTGYVSAMISVCGPMFVCTIKRRIIRVCIIPCAIHISTFIIIVVIFKTCQSNSL